MSRRRLTSRRLTSMSVAAPAGRALAPARAVPQHLRLSLAIHEDARDHNVVPAESHGNAVVERLRGVILAAVGHQHRKRRRIEGHKLEG